jgi:hypothetical protein
MSSTTERALIANPAPVTPARHRRASLLNKRTSCVGRFIVAGASLGVAAVLSISAPASADPKGEPLQVSCDNGTTYWAVDQGHGQFAPVHDVATNSMLIPTSFGEFHGVITDSTGAVVEEFTDPPVAKGSATKPRATSVSCTYFTSGHFDVPGLGRLDVTGSGTVEAFVAPVR